MFRSLVILFGLVIVISGFGCGSSSTSTTTANANSNSVSAKEIKLDPANMPAGLSANQVQIPANNMNMPPGISVNAVNMPIGNKPIPGIPSAEQLKKGFKPGKMPTPGIPDQETIRRQMSMPVPNVPPPPANSIPMMKNKRTLGGKTQ